MMYYGFGYGVLWFIVHIIGWVLAIWLIVWVIRLVFGRHPRRRPWMMNTHDAPEILRERYAKGEITKEQFETMKKDLE
jgi:putative membrane protein